MYLELAECQSCLNENENSPNKIPVVDDESGEIYLINMSMFARLTPQERAEAIEQAPLLMYILEKDNYNGMEGALWGKITQAVKGFVGKAKEFIGNATGSGGGGIFGGQNQTQPYNPNDPRFAGSFNIEPDPKPWFARPEVMIPVGLGTLGAIYLLTRKR